MKESLMCVPVTLYAGIQCGINHTSYLDDTAETTYLFTHEIVEIYMENMLYCDESFRPVIDMYMYRVHGFRRG